MVLLYTQQGLILDKFDSEIYNILYDIIYLQYIQMVYSHLLVLYLNELNHNIKINEIQLDKQIKYNKIIVYMLILMNIMQVD